MEADDVALLVESLKIFTGRIESCFSSIGVGEVGDNSKSRMNLMTYSLMQPDQMIGMVEGEEVAIREDLATWKREKYERISFILNCIFADLRRNEPSPKFVDLKDAIVQTLQTLQSLSDARGRGTQGLELLEFWHWPTWSVEWVTDYFEFLALPWLVFGAATGFLQPSRIALKQSGAIGHLETAYELILCDQQEHRSRARYIMRVCTFLLFNAHAYVLNHAQSVKFALLYTKTFADDPAKDPGEVFVQRALASQYRALNDPGKALEAARKMLKIADDQGIEGISLKRYQLQAARFLPPEEAVDVMERALAWKEGSTRGEEELRKESPEMLKGVTLLLSEYLKLSRFKEALKLVQWFDAGAYDDNQEDRTAWRRCKAELFVRLGDHPQACEVLDALSFKEGDENANVHSFGRYLRIADQLFVDGEYDSSIQAIDEWESMYGADLEAAMDKLPLCSTTETLLETMAMITSTPSVYTTRGFCKRALERYVEAMADLEKGVALANRIYGSNSVAWPWGTKEMISLNYSFQAHCQLMMGRSKEAEARVDDAFALVAGIDNMHIGSSKLKILYIARKYEEAESKGREYFLICASIQRGMGWDMNTAWVKFLDSTPMMFILKMNELSAYALATTGQQPYWKPLLWVERSHMRLFMFGKENVDFDRFDRSDEYALSIINQAAERCVNLNTVIIVYSYDGESSDFHVYLVTKVIADGNVTPSLTYAAQAFDLSEFTDIVPKVETMRDVEQIVTDARKAITTYNVDPKPHLAKLYQLLVQSVEERMHLPSCIDTLLFAPQGELYKVPFAALYDVRDKTFLIQKKCVHIIPGFRALHRCLDKQDLFQKNCAIKDELRPPFVAGNPMGPMGYTRVPLPEAAKEAEAVAELLGVEPVVRRAMTKAAVVDGLQTSSLVLIATHGEIKKDDPSEGSLAMQSSGRPSSDQQNPCSDEVLTGSEISILKVQAGLVILSACNSGDGTVTGEGLLGLGRALLLAGAATVIISPWAIVDASAKELVIEMMREFCQGKKTVIQSLQLAMQKMIEDGKSVSEWAGLAVLGSPTLTWPLALVQTHLGVNMADLSMQADEIRQAGEDGGEGRVGV